MEYKHFSHQHNLNLYQVQAGQEYECSGCETACRMNSMYYGCWECKFFLHEHCGNANRFLKHPSHPLHPLILLPSPTYCGASFLCNACGQTGKAFSYCCALCEVDLHVHCAFLPPKVNHVSHVHELYLSDTNSKTETKEAASRNCRLCNKVLHSKQWNYNCLKCDFWVHTFCATNEVRPGLYVDDHDDCSNEVQSQSRPHQSGGGGESTRVEEDRIVVELSDDAVVGLIKLQLQMQIAEMMGSTNPASYI